MTWLMAVLVLVDVTRRARSSSTRPPRLRRRPGTADLVDLLLLGARSGRDRRDALEIVAHFGRAEVAPAARRCVTRLDRGDSVDASLAPLRELDPALDVVVAVLGAAGESSESIALELGRLRSDVVQVDTATTAAAARRMAVWQTAPLVLCHLPAVVVVAVAPHVGF